MIAKRVLYTLFVLLVLLSACGQPRSAPTPGLVNPSSFTATAASANSLTLIWSAVEGATDYRLDRKNGSSFEQIAVPATTSYTDGGLQANTSYTYRVHARNAQGASSGRELTASTTGHTGPAQPVPFTVTGTARDTQGRPLAGAKVELEPALHEGVLSTRTDANGVYTFVDVPNIPYYVNAWHEIDYLGQTYCLRLGMPNLSDYDVFNARDGVVRNFQWQLSGEIDNYDEPWYFGGEIAISVSGDTRGGMIELAFTPSAALLDGSPSSSFTETFDPDEVYGVYDVPVSAYTVSATLIETNGTRTPLRLNTRDTYLDEPAAQRPLSFEPNGCNYASGVSPVSLFIYSPYAFEF